MGAASGGGVIVEVPKRKLMLLLMAEDEIFGIPPQHSLPARERLVTVRFLPSFLPPCILAQFLPEHNF